MSISTRAAAAVRAPPVLSRTRRRLQTPQYDALMRRKYGESNHNVWRLRCHKLALNIIALMHDRAVTADEARPYLEIIAQHNPYPEESAAQWLATVARDYGIACPDSVLDQIGNAADSRPRTYSPDDIGRALAITFADRERLELWQCGCCDVSARQRKELMRERKREKDRERRRDKGAKPRAEYLSGSLSKARKGSSTPFSSPILPRADAAAARTDGLGLLSSLTSGATAGFALNRPSAPITPG